MFHKSANIYVSWVKVNATQRLCGVDKDYKTEEANMLWLVIYILTLIQTD